MRLRTVALAAALTASVAPALADDKKEPPKKSEREIQLDAIIQDFKQARKEYFAALRATKTDQERELAEAKKPKDADFLPRVHSIVAAAKDETAAEALAFAVFGLNTKDQQIFESLSKDFVKTNKIKRFVEMAKSGAPDTAKPVLLNVLAQNPNRDIKGMACYALGTMAFEKTTPEAAKEAELYLARVEKEFGDVGAGRNGTLGDMAKGGLFELRNLQVGMKAPAAESKTLKGDKTSLADHKGKVVVLDIWATWCPPCRAMIPHEREMVEKLKGKPFSLISVSADEDKKELEDFLAKEPMPWTHWWEGADAALLKQWNVRYFPTIYVLDTKGVIRFKNLRGEELEKAVEKLLAEAK